MTRKKKVKAAPSRFQIVTIEPHEKKVWDDFIFAYSPGNLLQSYAWGEFKQLLGQKVRHFALLYDQAIITIAQVFFQKNPLSITNAYLPRGPIFGDIPSDMQSYFLKHLSGLARIERCMDLTIESDLLAPAPLENTHKTLQQLGFKATAPIQPQRTLLVDLNKSEEDLLASFKSKTRYNIRLAQKKGIEISCQTDKSALSDFYRLQKITAQRQHISIYPYDYFSTLFDTFGPTQQIAILSAYHKNDLLASLLLVFYQNTAFYLFGGTSDHKREYMANYLLHYEAMLLTQQAGYKYYDFWGIALKGDPHFEKWQGITRFKLGFGGKQVEYPPAYHKVFRRSQNWMYQGIKAAVDSPKFIKKLISKK